MLGSWPLQINACNLGAFVCILRCLWLQGEDGEFWTDIPSTQIRRVTAKRLLEAKQVSQWRLRGLSSPVHGATAPSTAMLAGRKAECAGLPASLLGRCLTALCRPLSLETSSLGLRCHLAPPPGAPVLGKSLVFLGGPSSSLRSMKRHVPQSWSSRPWPCVA